jgi:uncharacterized protein YkwD
MKFSILCILASLLHLNSSAQISVDCYSGDGKQLNEYIVREVNKYRKKAKVGPLKNDILLNLAATDHTNYMANKNKLTHFQRNRIKKNPKNRVDFYGEQFDLVGENVQQNWVQKTEKEFIKNCEELAKVLVTGWRNSPPHYANMIDENFTTTYTSVNINSKGKIYACQLFGSDAYHNTYRDSLLDYTYKPTKEKRCRKCERKQLRGAVSIINDSIIIFTGMAPKFITLPFIKSKFYKRRIWLNLFRYGIAADIVLKEQYDCDTNIVFNGKTGIRGIPLEPVFQKNFKKGDNVYFWMFTYIELGVVPKWVDQDYEVNLTLINNKRTCAPVIFNSLPVGFEVDINMDLYLDSLSRYYNNTKVDTFNHKLLFRKSENTVHDSILKPIITFVQNNYEQINSIEVNGFSSIEGSTEGNISLYKTRASNITQQLIELGIDSSLIKFSSQENYQDFRKDIIETQYSYLSTKSNLELKEEVNKIPNGEVESILATHRFTEVTILTKTEEQFAYTKDAIYDLLNIYIKEKDAKRCKKFQAIEYGLTLKNEVNLSDINAIKLPLEKKFINILCDRYLMIYRLDSLNPNRTITFRDSLVSLKKIDPKNVKVNTNIELLKYPEWTTLKYKKARKHYDSLVNNKYVDKTIKARMILNYVTYSDWSYTFRYPITNKRFYFRNVKQFIKPAKLNIEDTFEIATYYTYFQEYRFAYNLTKRKVYQSTSPDEIVFFLKLIYYLDSSLSTKTVIRHFKRIALLKGEEFCTYFNSPYLNFQILDNPEIRKIYCATCTH